ncbi:MAG TPA: serine/threonine-protein kinase [Thermoanaerobaculia bacterium]|jgi:serine/threonine-protein kinase
MTSDPDKTAQFEDLAPTPRPRRNEDQFAPGTMIAGRYRIASILGSGGMGEVYRADDTRLDQPVALKFLPARLARDPILRARLSDEVRLGRQIAHPNVCRIYDIVDFEHAQFVAMEYVDGEDLSRLLKRIGRLAHDKAVDIARGIAAGLAAAHAKGILHRDLKPANVMIDSRGEARIMDFGLALAAGEDDGTISGTPAYMAPEHLAGEPATVQSDLYALGLVFYELFTGKRAHSARTMPERMRTATSEITTPSSVIRDIDPAVERIILRCLSSDPAQRPRNAREVIESLPGGDPLAAALAAGETPSPRIVAAAGAEGSLTPAAAWTMLGAIALLLAISIGWRARHALTNYMGAQRSPEVLWERADELLRAFGIPANEPVMRQAYTVNAYVEWLAGGSDPRRWETLRNGPNPYRYRVERGQSLPLSQRTRRGTNAPGWSTIEVDTQGRLASLLAAPEGEWQGRPLDWQPLLAASGIDPASLRAVAPAKVPVAPFDARAAWTGTYPKDRTPVRIEAAAWRGTPTFFTVTGAWDSASGAARGREFANEQFNAYQSLLPVVVWLAGGLLAWRNFRSRRGDRRGATIVALTMFVLSVAESFFFAAGRGGIAAAVAHPEELIAHAASSGLFLFMVYLAVEPYARRRWPEQLIASTRLLSGRTRDPLVGRHVLIGLLGGAGHLALAMSGTVAGRIFGRDTGWSSSGDRVPGNLWDVLGTLSNGANGGLASGGLFMIVLVLFTILLRKKALAVTGLFIVAATFFMLAVGHRPEVIPSFLGIAALLTFVTVRYGALAVVVTQGTFLALFHEPLLAGGGWATAISPISLVAVTALAIWAFFVSLGGQSPFSAALLDD